MARPPLAPLEAIVDSGQCAVGIISFLQFHRQSTFLEGLNSQFNVDFIHRCSRVECQPLENLYSGLRNVCVCACV